MSYPTRRRTEPRHFDATKDAYPATPEEDRRYIEFRTNNRGGDRSVPRQAPHIYIDRRACDCRGPPDMVVNAERDEVCRNCGVVLAGGSSHLDFDFNLRAGEYWESADTGDSRRYRNSLHHPLRGSSYRHHYHFSEKLAVWCNVEPRIPEVHAQLITQLWYTYCAKRGYEPLEKARTAPKIHIQRAIKPLGHLARKYSERWIQICCMLLGDRDSTAPLRELGFAFPTIDVIQRLRRQFQVFVQRFLRIRRSGGFPDRRHNVPYLDSIIMQFLWGQSPALAHRLSWAFYPLRTVKHRCRSEARTAFIYMQLRRDLAPPADTKFKQCVKSVYNWNYCPLYRDSDIRLFQHQLDQFISYHQKA